MKKIYLPQLRKIRIENYSLYLQEPTFSFDFQEGINVIVGGNGIGKTTFVEIIVYCMVGLKVQPEILGRKKIKRRSKILNEGFFKKRMDDRYPNNNKAAAFLTFAINNTEIVIGRSLYDEKIIYFTYQGEKKEPNEELYKDSIELLSGISPFESLENLIRTFLFFDEGRSNVAWELENQDYILRTLLFEEEFFHQFKKLKDDSVYLDTQGRHLSEERRAVQGFLDDLRKSKEQIKNEYTDADASKSDKSPNFVLYQNKASLDQDILDLQYKLNNIIKKFKNTEEQYNYLIGERNSISQKIEQVSNTIFQHETKLYTSLYETLPDFYLSLEKSMASHGKCLGCGTISKVIRQKAEQRLKEKQCVICSSNITLKEHFNPEILNIINKLNDERNELNVRLSNKNAEISELASEITKFNESLSKLRSMLDQKKREMITIESLIAEQEAKNETDTYTEIVKEKNLNIEKLTDEIKKKYDERDQKLKEIQVLHSRFAKVVRNLNNSLSNFFYKYATEFIGLPCELTVVEQTDSNGVPHIIYVPQIDGKPRFHADEVSESQRFFLDQAFRIAIIDYLQTIIPGFSTFFITETPEGSLDVAYEKQVANMFCLFGQSSNKIIFTSNLNSSGFLLRIYEKMVPSEKSQRTLNLLTKGKLTKVQEDSDLKTIQLSLWR